MYKHTGVTQVRKVRPIAQVSRVQDKRPDPGKLARLTKALAQGHWWLREERDKIVPRGTSDKG